MSVETIIILGAITVGAILTMIGSFALLARMQRRARRRRSMSWYYD
jgi:uncharacterized integral membrane protein